MPANENTKVEFGSFTFNEKVPSIVVVVPFCVPFSTTLTPGIVTSSSVEITVPVIVTWLQTVALILVALFPRR